MVTPGRKEFQPIPAMSTAGYIQEGKYQKRHRATFGLLVCVALTLFLLVAAGASVFGWFLITHREEELFLSLSPPATDEGAGQWVDVYNYDSDNSLSEPPYEHDGVDIPVHGPTTHKQTMTSQHLPHTTRIMQKTTQTVQKTTEPVDSGLDISQAMDRLWQASVEGYLSPGDDFVLNVQGNTRHNGTEDKAPQRLFTEMIVDVRRSSPLHRKFVRLLNDYQTSNEDITRVLADQTAFLEVLCRTDTVSVLERYLLANDYLDKSQNICTFLEHMWFTAPRVSGRAGFDQVYVNGDLAGVGRPSNWPNNWLQLYLEEKAGSLDYQGYVTYKQNILLEARYSWQDIRWPITTSTVLLGSSPDFEVTAYSLCLVTNPNNNCSFNLNGEHFTIETRGTSVTAGLQITSANFMVV